MLSTRKESPTVTKYTEHFQKSTCACVCPCIRSLCFLHRACVQSFRGWFMQTPTLSTSQHALPCLSTKHRPCSVSSPGSATRLSRFCSHEGGQVGEKRKNGLKRLLLYGVLAAVRRRPVDLKSGRSGGLNERPSNVKKSNKQTGQRLES